MFLRNQWGINDGVDLQSGLYIGGQLVGIGNQIAMGGGGIRAGAGLIGKGPMIGGQALQLVGGGQIAAGGVAAGSVAAGAIAVASGGMLGMGAANMCSIGPGRSGSKLWDLLKPFRGKTRTNGLKGRKQRYYEWDRTHGDIEVYDSNGQHLGSMDANTGLMTKPMSPGREIKIK